MMKYYTITFILLLLTSSPSWAQNSLYKSTTLGRFTPHWQENLRDFGAKITINKNANAYTTVHEMAHWYLTTLEKMVKSGIATKTLKSDYQMIKQVFGSDTDKLGFITTDVHEKFAYTIERYLHTSIAPNPALEETFEVFKLVDPEADYMPPEYRDFPLTSGVRAVYDGMLSSPIAAPINIDKKALNAAALNIINSFDNKLQKNIVGAMQRKEQIEVDLGSTILSIPAPEGFVVGSNDLAEKLSISHTLSDHRMTLAGYFVPNYISSILEVGKQPKDIIICFVKKFNLPLEVTITAPMFTQIKQEFVAKLPEGSVNVFFDSYDSFLYYTTSRKYQISDDDVNFEEVTTLNGLLYINDRLLLIGIQGSHFDLQRAQQELLIWKTKIFDN